MRDRIVTTTLVAFVLLAPASHALATEFRAICPYQPPGVNYAQSLKGRPLGRVLRTGFNMSSDGFHLVGAEAVMLPDGSYWGAWRWPIFESQETLGFLPHTDEVTPWSAAFAVSRDGRYIVGSSLVGKHRLHHLIWHDYWEVAPFRWHAGSFTQWPRDHDQSHPVDLTPDGRVAVGIGQEQNDADYIDQSEDLRALRWVDGSIEVLEPFCWGPPPFWCHDDAVALAVSDSGNVVLGLSGRYVRFSDGAFLPVIWIDGSPELLGLLQELPDDGHNTAWDISGNGLYSVGRLWDGAYYVPVRWDNTTRLPTTLGLYGSDTYGTAHCASADGSIVGGRSGNQAVVWNLNVSPTPVPVKDLLFGQQPAGWRLESVRRISADGKIASGVGFHPNGDRWIWWADLRMPPTNDRCASARDITPNHSMVPFHIFTETYTATGSTADASNDGAASCSNTSSNAFPNVNLWYSYTAPVEGYLSLDLCGMASTWMNDLFIAVHTSCPGNPSNEILCSTNCPSRGDCSLLPCVMPPALRLDADQTVYAQVGGWAADDDVHTFSLRHQFLPINDHCDDAIAIEDYPLTVPGNTARMGVDAAAVCGEEAPTAPGVWYSVMGTGTELTASTCGLADYDTKISVFCGGCGSMKCVATDDDGCGGAESSVTWCSEEGMVYHILVHGYQSNAGQFRLQVDHAQQSCTPTIDCVPANDSCTEAFPVRQGTLLADNTGATTSIPETSCAESTGHDLWYSYTTRCEGELWVDTCDESVGSMVNSVITIYDECSGAELACNDNYADPPDLDCGLRSAAIAELGQGRDVRIRVAGYGSPGYEGTFPLRVTEVPAPLTVPSYPLPDALTNDPYEVQLEFWGSCGQRRVTADNLPLGLSVNSLTGVISGVPLVAGLYPIYVEVCDQIIPDGQCANGEVFLRVWPSNDDCAQATPVTEGHHPLSNTDSTTDGPDEPGACDFSGYTHVQSDIWYRYTASCNGLATVDLCEVDYNSKLAVYQGGECPAASAAWLCNDDDCGGLGSRLRLPVEAGAEYLLRVGGSHAAQGQGEMLITCFNDCNGNEQSDTEEILAGAPDCNENGSPDECDLRGDFSNDGTVNLLDLDRWIGCVSQPCQSVPCEPPAYPAPCCGWIDFDEDGDVDLVDIAELQRRFGATQNPVEWQLLHTYQFADPVAAHFNPADELVYVGRFSGTMGLYRLDVEGSTTALWTGDNIIGVVIDPSDGDIFTSDDWSGEIFRTEFGHTGRTMWAAGFHGGDDDPIGLAIAPLGYSGSVVAPGKGLVVDRGYNGPDEVWRWSPATAEGETVVHADNGTLINAVDIAIGNQHVYLVDSGDENGGPNPGTIYELHADGSLSQLATSEPLIEPVGIAIDPVTQNLFVAESADDRIVRVDVDTGMVTDVLTGFTGLFWASVDVAPDGSRLIVTDHGGDEIHVFERTP